MANFLMKFGRYLLIDRKANKQSVTALVEQLHASGPQILERCNATTDSEFNRKMLSHIIGIERWGQSRLAVAQGEPQQMDEYDGYRPAPGRTWDELKADFTSTRDKTIALATAIDQDFNADGVYVPHNQFGDMSVRSWLYYLNYHANQESKRIK